MAGELNPAVKPAMGTGMNPYAAPRALVAGEEDDDETQEVRIFAVSGRMGRIRYLANLMGIYILLMVALFAAGAVMGATRMREPVLLWVVMGIGYIAMIVIGVMMAIQRMHDADQSGWWVLLSLVPFVNLFFGLYLLFMPGTQGRNRWGPRTPPNGTFSVILACILPALFVLGIVAAIALPAYQDYSKRARISAPH